MTEGFAFNKETARRLVKAANIVLDGGDFGTTSSPTPISNTQCILAQITDVSGGFYGWKQVRRLSGGGYEDVTTGLTGTTDKNFAFDIADTGNTEVGDYVVLVRMAVDNGTSTPAFAWGFSTGGGGKGQYQGQVYQMVSQNSAGWDYPIFHTPTS